MSHFNGLLSFEKKKKNISACISFSGCRMFRSFLSDVLASISDVLLVRRDLFPYSKILRVSGAEGWPTAMYGTHATTLVILNNWDHLSDHLPLLY